MMELNNSKENFNSKLEKVEGKIRFQFPLKIIPSGEQKDKKDKKNPWRKPVVFLEHWQVK